MEYTELQVTSNFTFLRGGSHPEELIDRALELGYKTIAITDRNTLAGIVRAHAAARGKDIRFLPACRLDLVDGPSLLAFPTNKASYSQLSALLTRGNLRAEKGECHLYKKDVYEHAADTKFIALSPDTLQGDFSLEEDFIRSLEEYQKRLAQNLYLGASFSYRSDDHKRRFQLSRLASRLGTPLVATNDVHYHAPDSRELPDVLPCIREKCTIPTAGFRLHPNAERYLKPQEEMNRLFREYTDAILRTQEIADACQFSLDQLTYVYPEEITTEGRTPQEELVHLTWLGAKELFGKQIPEQIKETINYVLEFMARKNYASYFLASHDFVRFAREREILCQGRGSAANTVVCFCLGITS